MTPQEETSWEDALKKNEKETWTFHVDAIQKMLKL